MANEQTSTNETQTAAGSAGLGVVQGVPGPKIAQVGVLDLRGVPVEQVTRIESIREVGIVLLDEANRSSLAQASLAEVGSVIVAGGPDDRVLIEPWLEISRATVEAMPPGQKLILIGVAWFKPDVPAAVVAEKFEKLHVVGVLFASASVQGALLGKIQSTGLSVTLPDDVGTIIPSIGHNRLTAGYLSHLPDDILYLNVGATEIPSDVTEALLAQKIKTYYNVGGTIGPAPLLELLKARCPANLGEFKEPDTKGDAEESADEGSRAVPAGPA
jgi:hypothetical protein